MVEFYKYKETSEFLDPKSNYTHTQQTIEFRKHPLTGSWCRINIDRAKRPHTNNGTLKEVDKKILAIAKKTENCFFCPANVDKKTPKHQKHISPEGRLRNGQFILFPNLFPFAPYHGVGVLKEKHFVSLNNLDARTWENALETTIDWFKKVYSHDSAARFASFNFNYLMPAAASLIHPHIQPIVDKRADNGLDDILKKSWQYSHDNNSNFWQDLLDNDEERYIGKTGKSVYWHASFAPSCANEVVGIVCGKSSFLELDSHDIEGIADGIAKVLRGLYAQGVRSVNMTINSAPLNESLASFFYLNIRIVSRSLMVDDYTTDQGFMELLHKEPVISTIPETIAKNLREYF
ncbi:MAG: hypothetical protein KAI53_02205 [Candidatus Aenigmarchaeota archaeon]|nr:hypothetical protein [Candidatus Aenigmarchaeota archaeon]